MQSFSGPDSGHPLVGGVPLLWLHAQPSGQPFQFLPALTFLLIAASLCLLVCALRPLQGWVLHMEGGGALFCSCGLPSTSHSAWQLVGSRTFLSKSDEGRTQSPFWGYFVPCLEHVRCTDYAHLPCALLPPLPGL